MKNKPEQLCCSFCGGQCFYRYSMDEYAIWQCQRCKTGCVWPMPSVEELKKYYDGFLSHQLNMNMVLTLELAAKKLFLHLGLCSGRNLKMLDIGGGGGFFSKAFEDLGYGESTYVDLDLQSCNFAQNSLELKRVFNCDAINIKEYLNTKFDFIYCRHVIEHLLDPAAFLGQVMDYLNDNGMFVVQFPNGNSLEYLAYPDSTIRHRFTSICKTNKFSKPMAFWIMLSGGMLHGIDPPRHLWAITKKGIKKWANKKDIICGVYSYHLGNLAYSPYYQKSKTFKGKVQEFIGQYLLSRIYGGTHLVTILQRNPLSPDTYHISSRKLN